MAEGKTITIIQRGNQPIQTGCTFTIYHMPGVGFGDHTIIAFDAGGTTYEVGVDEWKDLELLHSDDITISNVRITRGAEALRNPRVGLYNQREPWNGTFFRCNGTDKEIKIWVYDEN